MIRDLWVAWWRWYWQWNLDRAAERRVEVLIQKIEEDRWIDQRETKARRALEKLNRKGNRNGTPSLSQ